jgi:hypothetical protein
MALLTKRALLAAMLALGIDVHAQLAAETDLRTAFVYNFIVLTTWPAEAGPVLRFCVAGAAASAAPFRALGGKSAGERTVAVQSVASPEHAAECAILFVPAAESGRLAAWLAGLANRPTLTISDQANTGGAMVGLRLANGRIVFDVDTRAAAAANIVLSSQLIKLAAARQ